MTVGRIPEPIAITGATSFIGSHLLSHLLGDGYSLIALSSQPAFPAHSTREPVRWQQLDIRDPDAMRRFLFREKPATFFHLAGTRGRRDARDAEVACTEVNFEATAQLLELAMQSAVERVVLIGSAEEYGNQPGPLSETMPLMPATPYGVSKARATNLAKQLHKERGCPVVVVRPFTVYGPKQPVDMFLGEAVCAAVNGAPFKMSVGEQRRDFVYVDDIVRGVLLAASVTGIEGTVTNLGSGIARRLRDVATTIWEMTASSAPLLIGERDAAPQELYDTWADINEARARLGWEPEVSFEDGLRQTIEWFAAQSRDNEKLCQAR